MPNSLDPDQDGDQKSEYVCKGSQQTAKVAASREIYMIFENLKICVTQYYLRERFIFIRFNVIELFHLR